MTSLAHQTRAELGGPLSVLTRQKKDHVHLDQLLHELATAPPGDEEERVLRRMARLVFPHAFAEESDWFEGVTLAKLALREQERFTKELAVERFELSGIASGEGKR